MKNVDNKTISKIVEEYGIEANDLPEEFVDEKPEEEIEYILKEDGLHEKEA